MLAVAVDERIELGGVGLLEQAQARAARQLEAEHYVATVSAPSSSLIATSIE